MPDHVPVVAESVRPTVALPETVGGELFGGGVGGITVAVNVAVTL